MQVQEEVRESEPDIEALRRRLQCRRGSSRQEAELELSRLRANDLIQLMAAEKRHRSRRQKTLLAIVVVYIVFAVTIAIVGRSAHIFNIVGSFGGVVAGAMAFSQAHKSAAKALAQYDELDGVSPLIEAMEIPDREVNLAVTESLTRILPKMRSSDAALLTPDARRILRKQLAANPSAGNRDKSDQFIEAALKSLGQVGDESFIEATANLAEGHGYGSSYTVRAAAEECLPALRQRVENDRLSHDLLRASAPATSYNRDQLLRAAESSGATESSVLLRASGGAATEEFRA